MESADDGKLKFYCCLFPDLLGVFFINGNGEILLQVGFYRSSLCSVHKLQ